MTECSSESQNVQTATSGTDNQKVQKTVEFPKQQYTDMNVDVPAEMQRRLPSHTDGAENGRSTTGSVRHVSTIRRVHSGKTSADDSEDAVGSTVMFRRC